MQKAIKFIHPSALVYLGFRQGRGQKFKEGEGRNFANIVQQNEVSPK